MGKQRNWCTLFGVNLFVLILYCLMVILVVCAAVYGYSMAATGADSIEDVDDTFLMLIMTIGEALVIGVPVLLFAAIGRAGKALLKLSKPRAADMLLTFGLAVGGFGVFMFLEILTQMVLSSLNLPQQGLDITFPTRWHLAAWIGALGLIPAIVEEFAFRGIVLGVYERHLRPFWAILLSAALFGLLHLQLAFFHIFLGIGVILGWIVYRSRSVWTGVLYHFTHNTLAVVLSYLSEAFAGPAAYQAESSVPDSAVLITWGIIAAVCLVIFLGCLFPFARLTKGRVPVTEKPARSPFVDWAPLLVIGVGLLLLIGTALLGAILLPALMENMPVQ